MSAPSQPGQTGRTLLIVVLILVLGYALVKLSRDGIGHAPTPRPTSSATTR